MVTPYTHVMNTILSYSSRRFPSGERKWILIGDSNRDIEG